MSTAPPAAPSRSVKAATLLFSGAVAALVILHSSSGGCAAPADPQGKATAKAASTKAASAKAASAKAKDEAAARIGAANAAAAAKADAAEAAAGESEEAPPPRYLGGSKSDVDVWGPGIKGTPEPPATESQGAKGRGAR